MMKTRVVQKIVVLSIILLFVGLIAIQSTGILNTNQTALLHDDTTQPEGTGADDSGTNEDRQGDDSILADSTIIPFIEKLTHRYPVLKRLGEHMGLNKYSASSIIQQYGNDNIVTVYILIFTKLLNL